MDKPLKNTWRLGRKNINLTRQCAGECRRQFQEGDRVMKFEGKIVHNDCLNPQG